ncbi:MULTISPECIES: AAA family ATPase [unclassified Brevundimonas]|uniref:AAA family ATPase n=1 Tax=unclassified Brevundimonas TaxID=2622653 RepID=UPI0025C327B7|nr:MULTISPECIES: AAA family ATPase [unclassified Brevundimonas]
MDDAGFREMLLGRGNAPTGVETRIGYLRTIEKHLAGLGLPFADLDAAFDADGLASAIEAVRGLMTDYKAGGTDYRLLFPQSVNPGNRLANLPTFLKHYRDYRSGAGTAESDAGRIRRFALEHFVEPARAGGKATVSLRAGDLHNALGLSNAHANVCQALRGRLFRSLAGVGEPVVSGPENSSTTTFEFRLVPSVIAPTPPARRLTKPMLQAAAPTNLILYGPPGTGKTFATAQEAVKLCSPGVDLDDRAAVDAEYRRLVEARQVEFVTFHQSYSYEDFVEGLRPPVSGKDGEGDEDKSGFRLEVSPGVFHRVATRAAASKGSTGKSFDLTGRQVFKMSIGEAANPEDAYLFEESLQNGYALLGFGEIDWSDERFARREAMIQAWKDEELEADPPTPQSARVQCPDMFRNWIGPGDILIVSKGNGSFRAIGEVTGPYEYAPRDDGGYFHRRAVNWLWSDRSGVPVEEIYAKRFSMRTLYMLTPSDLNMSALQRYITSQEPGGPPEPFVLIIDEINRANISKVFGELITLLEPDKRTTPDGGGLKVRLPYSKEAFGVPSNLHVIGTMNTADRSIALLDTALRRRFEFRELMPDPDLPELKIASAHCGVDIGKLLQILNERIEYLFDREHQIGHAYFIKCASRGELDAVMRRKVIPLLAEYFYEDWSKVALVLGDADLGKPGRFLDRTVLKPPAGLDADGGDTRWRWTVRKDFAPDAYADFQ